MSDRRELNSKINFIWRQQMKLILIFLNTIFFSNFSYACPEVNFDQVRCNDITNTGYFKGNLSFKIYNDENRHVLSAMGDEFFWFIAIPSVSKSNGILQKISCTDNSVIFEDSYDKKTNTSILTIKDNGFDVIGHKFKRNYTCENDDIANCRLDKVKEVLIHSKCLVTNND